MNQEQKGKRDANGIMASVNLSPLDHFQQSVEELSQAVQQEHLSSEQSLQDALGQASANIADSQNLQTIHDLCLQLQGQIQTGLNKQESEILLLQLEKQIAQQQTQVNKQVIGSLQQTVTALMQCQFATSQSQALTEMGQLVQTCQKWLQQLPEKKKNIH